MGKRKEFVQTIDNVAGDYGLKEMNLCDKDFEIVSVHMNLVFERLVSCRMYGKLMDHIKGNAWTSSRVNMMARKGKLNSFKFSGFTFILLTSKEYEVYFKEILVPVMEKENHARWRNMWRMQPKNREQSERFAQSRSMAISDWRQGKYEGEEWNRFFVEEMLTFEDKFATDSVGKWLKTTDYHANANSELKIRTKQFMKVGDLWEEYKEWCAKDGYIPKYIKQFSKYMTDVGFTKRFADRSRVLDVFVPDSDVFDSTAIEMREVLVNNDAEVERLAKEKEDWQKNQRLLRKKMEKRMKFEKDKVWLSLVGKGQHEGRVLYDAYVLWADENCAMTMGRKTFYAWLEQEGFQRETVGGVLHFERREGK